jgi:hypothetical protein
MRRWLEEIRDGMNEMQVLIGVWLFLSPWIIGFAQAPRAAALMGWLSGAVLIVSGSMSAFLSERVQEAITLAFGAVTLLSPWALSFAGRSGPALNFTLVGGLIAAVGLRALLDDTEVGEWLRNRLHAR